MNYEIMFIYEIVKCVVYCNNNNILLIIMLDLIYKSNKFEIGTGSIVLVQFINTLC